MIYKLGEECDFINGGSWNANEYSEEGYPVLKVSNFERDSVSYSDISFLSKNSFEKYKRHILYKNDIVVATVGSHPSLVNSAAGRALTIPKKAEGYLLNQNAACIRTKYPDKIDQRYLGYLCKSQVFQHFIQQRGKGAANQMRIPIGGIKSFKFDFPEIETQRKIAAILSAYDDLIENNLRRIQLLEEMAQLTYEEWFVRMKFPGHEEVAWDEETGLPEGWERVDLGSVINNFDSKRIPVSKMAREKRKGHFPYYGASSVMDFIDDYIFDGRYVLMGEDGTVITKRGTPMLQFVQGKIWVNNHAHVLKGKLISDELLYLFLNQYPISGHITGVAQPKINQKNMNRIQFNLPNEELTKQLDEIIKPIFDVVFVLEKQSQLLKEARDILLPRLMTGMIDVENIDIETLTPSTT